jgi:hypothetical protein
MTRHHVTYVSLVVRRAEHLAQAARDAGEGCRELRLHGASAFAGTREGRFCSKILKILEYSSVHDEGRTNA